MVFGKLENFDQQNRVVTINGTQYKLADWVEDKYITVGNDVSYTVNDNVVSYITNVKPKQNNSYGNANKPFKQNNKPEVDWDKIAFGKCKHSFLLEAYKLGKNLEEAEKEAEAWAEASVRVAEDLL